MTYSKSPIKLRQRKMPSGNISLYLDIYHNGYRAYEYLKLYLVPEKTRTDKLQNRQTMEFAEAVLAKRIVELRNGEYGFKQHKMDVPFFEYFERICTKRYNTTDPNKWRTYGAVYKIICLYEKRANIKLSNITSKWVEGLKDYMDNKLLSHTTTSRRYTSTTKLSNITKAGYISKLSAIMNKAVKEDLIDRNPVKGVERYQIEESRRMYLTPSEVTLLSSTPCHRDNIKRAFLFSCLTGLRYSDVSALTWEQVHTQDHFTRLIFRQQKTKGQEYLDINPQAVSLMGERGKAEDSVFSLPTLSNVNIAIQRWVSESGIKKHITYHCARHTFATLMLDIGTDLYTVSKLLGHREIGTTQIYARILDKNKQVAVSAIPQLLKEE